MENTMPEVQMRRKHQVTIPAGMVEEDHLSGKCIFDVDSVNGVSIFTPKNLTPKKDDVMSYAGIFSGTWGETPAEALSVICTMNGKSKRSS